MNPNPRNVVFIAFESVEFIGAHGACLISGFLCRDGLLFKGSFFPLSPSPRSI